MSFYDDLSRPPSPPEPNPAQEETMETRIRRLMDREDFQKIADEMARTIRQACLAARDRGERRVFGTITGFRRPDTDRDGYTYPDTYSAIFTPWVNGVRVYQIRQDYDPRNSRLTYWYDTREDRDALLRLLSIQLVEDGFPVDCLSLFQQEILLYMADGVPESWQYGWEYGAGAKHITSHLIEVDISW